MKRLTLLFFLVLAAATASAQERGSNAGLVGTWEGRWERGPEHVLVVEKADEKSAALVYRAGESARTEETSRGQRVTGVIVDGVLYAKLRSGAQLTYTLSADSRTLVGHYARDGRTWRGEFARR